MDSKQFIRLPSAPGENDPIAVYAAGTDTLVEGLVDLTGQPLSNPFTPAEAGGSEHWGYRTPTVMRVDEWWAAGGRHLGLDVTVGPRAIPYDPAGSAATAVAGHLQNTQHGTTAQEQADIATGASHAGSAHAPANATAAGATGDAHAGTAHAPANATAAGATGDAHAGTAHAPAGAEANHAAATVEQAGDPAGTTLLSWTATKLATLVNAVLALAATVFKGILTNYKETVDTAIASVSGELTLSTNANRLRLTLTENVTNVLTPSLIAPTTGESLVLVIVTHATVAYTFAWGSADILWLTSDGAPPELNLTAGGKHNVVTLISEATTDKWLGFLAGSET